MEEINNIGNFCKLLKINGIVQRISFNDEWFDVISDYNSLKCSDGQYRYIYCQIDEIDNMYYVGRASKSKLELAKWYQGSGNLIKLMRKKYNINFRKYIIIKCDTEDELNDWEAKIVTQQMIDNEIKLHNRRVCLNLTVGGQSVGMMRKYTKEEMIQNRNDKIRKHHQTEEFRKFESDIVNKRYEDEEWKSMWYKRNIESCRTQERRKANSETQKEYLRNNIEEYNRRCQICKNHNNKIRKRIKIKDIKTEQEFIFDSISEAGRYIKKIRNISTEEKEVIYRIGRVANGKQHTSQGFIAEFC